MENRVAALPYAYYVLTNAQTDLPRHGTYYIVAGNGVFLHKGSDDPKDVKSGLVESVTRVMGPQEKTRFWKPLGGEAADVPVILPGLNDCETFANIKITQIPHLVARTAQAFFARVLKVYGGEAEVQLYYCQKLDRFQLVCPPQTVSRGGVEYDQKPNSILDAPEGIFLRAGTIHSHCDFMAYHSGVDTADEEYEDGLHITFGHVNQPERKQPFTVVASVVANNHRFPLDPADCIDGIEYAYERAERGFSWSTAPRENNSYYAMKPLGDRKLDEQVERQISEWLPNVRKQSFWGSGTQTVRPSRRRKGNYSSTELGFGGDHGTGD